MKAWFRYLIGLAMILAQSQALSQSCGVPGTSWTACSKSSDCMVFYDDCGPIGVYAEKYKRNVADYLSCEHSTPQCSASTTKRKIKVKAVCKDGLCRTLEGSSKK